MIGCLHNKKEVVKHMSIENHITELSVKHRSLDAKIQNEQKSPAPNPLEITALKRQKLRLKEQLANLTR